MMSRFDAWAEGPYSMQAVCSIIREPNGSVFVQMRTAADSIFDQHILGTRTGNDEQEVVETLMAEHGVCEIVELPRTWHRGPVISIPFREQVEREKKRRGLLAAIANCETELARLQAELNKHHDEV